MSPPSRPVYPVAVLGAGITGLTAAWHLQRARIPVVVFEASARVGGVIGAVRSEGWLHETGPNSLLEGSVAVSDLIAATGLSGRRLYAAPAAKNRYIVRGGALVAMPGSPGAFLGTRLFSWRAKLNLLGEPFRGRPAAGREESVEEFVRRRLGREFLDYAVDPLVGGIYAGDPGRLSVRHAFPKLYALEREHGSLIRGAIRRRDTSGGPRGRILSFPDGLEELPRALARPLGAALRRNCAVQTVRRRALHWEIFSEDAGESRAEKFSAVISALPPDALARVRFEAVPAARRLADLPAMEQSPVVSVFAGFRRGDVTHSLDGFGLLVPWVEKRRILGTLFSSTLFPGRAPEGHVALTTFVGGARQPELAQLGDDALLFLVRNELEGLLGISDAPVWTHVCRWPRAIPQYTMEFGAREAAYAAIEAEAPGLFIGGNGRDGISLSYCVESGRRLAAAAAGFG